MFSVVRFLIGCVFLGCSIIVIKRSKITYKRILYIVSVITSVVVFVLLSFLPFENLFVSFDSPEAAYKYCTLGKTNIALVVEGNDCDFVIDQKNETDTYLIIPKTADGWKIGLGSDVKIVAQSFSNNITVYVYQNTNTEDYFVTILDTKGGESTVTDDFSSKFYSAKRYNESLGEEFVTYYAHIPDFNTQYSVIVNGNRIALGG